MPLAFSHLSLCATFTFYHGGNWPTSLLVVGGSRGGSCTSGVYHCIVWFYGSLIASYCLLVVNKRHSKRWLGASCKVFLLCCPSCLSLSLLMASFISWMHIAVSPRLNRYDFFSYFSQGPSSMKTIPRYDAFYLLTHMPADLGPSLLPHRVHHVSSPCYFRWLRKQSRGFLNIFLHLGHTVGYSLSQAGTWCCSDFTLWFI